MDISSSDDDELEDVNTPSDPKFGRISGGSNEETARKKGSSYSTKMRNIQKLKSMAQELVNVFPGEVEVLLFVNHTRPQKPPNFYGFGYGDKAKHFLNETELGKEMKSKLKVTAQTWLPRKHCETENVIESGGAQKNQESEQANIISENGSEQNLLPNVSTEASRVVAKGIEKSRQKQAKQAEKLAQLKGSRERAKAARNGKKTVEGSEKGSRKKATAIDPVVKSTNGTVASDRSNDASFEPPVKRYKGKKPPVTAIVALPGTSAIDNSVLAPSFDSSLVTPTNLNPSQANETKAFDNLTKVVIPAKVKCCNFLSTILSLAKKRPEPVSSHVQLLVQKLVDGELKPEEFIEKLKELKLTTSPNVTQFLTRTMPILRESLVSLELSIEGINPPAMFHGAHFKEHQSASGRSLHL